MTFVEFAESHGLLMRKFIPDGRWHRTPTQDHPKKQNGAYRFDGQFGFVKNWALHDKAIAYRPDGSGGVVDAQELRELIRRRAAERARDEAAARRLAAEIINAATWRPHPYLERKGFPQECGMVHELNLIVPMWDMDAYGKRLNSVQKIAENGSKKFLIGGKAKGSIYRLGSGPELWHCEGLATGLSIQAALKRLYRAATVVVSFSAGNLEHVAKALGGRVVADRDDSGTGERAAKATGLPWCIPPQGDANDYHQSAGIDRVAMMLRALL